jgi:hypothetical protein
MTNYTILLPPSEGKTQGGNEELPFRLVDTKKEYNSFRDLQANRDENIY